jgi:hypothetical protein
MIFLIDYDRQAGNIVRIEEFDSSQRNLASQVRLDLEIELFTQGVVREVVLLEADSLEALKKTHNRYFRNVSDLAKSVKVTVKLTDRKDDGEIPS